MTDHVAPLRSLYQYLHRFYQPGSSAQVQARLPQAASQLSSRIISLYHSHPQWLLAQFNCPPADTTLLSRLALQQATCLLIISTAAHWPAELQEELIAAALYSLMGLNQLPEDLTAARQGWQNPWLLTIRTQQTVLRQHHWLALYASCVRYQQRQPLWQQTAYAVPLCLTYQLCHAINDAPAGSLRAIETQYRRLWLQGTALERALLNYLHQAGPALYQLGRACRDEARNQVLVCQAEPELAGCVLDAHSQSLLPVQTLSNSHWRLLAPALCPNWQWYTLLSGAAAGNNAEPPTPPLTPAQIRLLNPNWSISRQVAVLAEQPALAQTLLAQASAQAREKLPVDDLRHALAMLGTEQLQPRLLHSWLLAQINQTAHPWQAWFAGFATVFSHSLQLFSQYQRRLSLDAPTADLLSSTLILALQRVAALRYLPLQAPARQHDSLVLQCRRQLWQNDTFVANVAALLAELGVSVSWQDAFLQLQASTDQLGQQSQLQPSNLLLHLALQFSEWLYLGGPSQPGQLDITLKLAQQHLALPTQPARHWLEQLLARTQCCWPLQPFDIL